MSARTEVLKKYPKAVISCVVWPARQYWVMPSDDAPDSISVGKRTAREAWANARERIRKGLE